MSVTEQNIAPEAPAAARPRRALLLINPRSGRAGAPLDSAERRLREAGLDLIRRPTGSPEEMTRQILDHADQVDRVIIGGGDGTVNSAAPGLLATGLPLGVLPLGTANDLARTLSLPMDPAVAAEVIAQDRVRRIDIGLVNGRPFFNVASIGLSTELASALSGAEKRRLGRLSYALAALRVLSRARPFRAIIINQGQAVRVKTYQIAVGSGRYYGGGVAVAHDAEIDDARLDLYSLEVASVWKLALMAPHFRRGQHGA